MLGGSRKEYGLARLEDFIADLNLLRRHYRELADAPALSDAAVCVTELLVKRKEAV